MFIDEIKVYARAGHGGKGCVAFHREAYITKGGPSGGNGGRGGDVILEADHDLNNLIAQYYQPRLIAKDGEAGMGKGMDGKAGKDLIIKVPCGTLVWKLPAPPAAENEGETESEEPTIRLREITKGLDTIENPGMRANLMAATAVFAGLVMEPEMIKTILRSDIMKESAFYQDILQEGRQEGLQMGRQEGLQMGRQEGEVALLMRLLVKRFGNVSESIESRLTQASIADLELWSDRILEAKTLTDIFD